MKAPQFWQQRTSIASIVLRPLAWLYQCAVAIYQRTTIPYRSKVPVICVGNVIAGGAGKTPTALAIATLCLQQKRRIVFVSKGYKGKLKGPVRVNLKKHSATDVGDEALLLASTAPVIVAYDRKEGIKAAEVLSPDLIIMDDGLQNSHIRKDLSILVLDGKIGIGNGELLPSGPMRETLRNVSKRIDLVVLIGQDRKKLQKNPYINKHPIIKAEVKKANRRRYNKTYIAFAGIAYPNKFFNFLKREEGATLLESYGFEDHYCYEKEEIKQLIEEAKSQKAKLITTEKDKVRISAIYHKHIDTLPITLAWKDPSSILTVIERLCLKP